MFAHLHCVSHYSFLDGASTLDDLVSQAAREGVTHLALTDRAGVYATVEFSRKAEEAGVRPLVGAEIPAGQESVVALSRDIAGYTALCQALTWYHLEGPGRRDEPGEADQPDTPGGGWGAAVETGDPGFPEGCDALAPPAPLEAEKADEGGQDRLSAGARRPDTGPRGLDWARLSEGNWLLTDSPALLGQLVGDCGPSSVLAELVDHGTPGDRRRNLALLECARALGVRAVASQAARFARPGDHCVHRLLSAIRHRETVGRPGRSAPVSPEAWLKGPADVARIFREVPEAVSAAVEVAESCAFRFTTRGMLHPPFPVPQGETAYSLLWKRAFAGAARLYRPLRPDVIHRLEHELSVICETGFAEYFLIVADVADFAVQKGIPCTGRGSAAGSLTAYALGITHVDPIALRLSFERFLNPQRTDPPDIDMDFCWRRRPEVIRHIYDTYGRENAAMLSTHVRMAGRMAIREAARAMGLPENEITRFTRHIPHHDARHIDVVLREIPECKGIPFDEEPYRSVLDMARRIAGFPRHLGLHPCGLVLSRVPLTGVTPLQMTAAGFPATQFEMRAAEDVGLLKVDILGQRSLSVIADSFACLREAGDAVQSPAHVPPDDPGAWEVIREGRTMGCFQVESPGMRGLLRKLRPRDMEAVIAASSVIRPGPSDAGMLREFILRHHGESPVEYLHPSMEAVLDTTLGIMVYQEDILRVAHAVAGIDMGEADRLRRAMSSKRSAAAMRDMRDTFVGKAEGRGVAAAVARRIWAQMETFSGYAFCKAHSASYAVLSYQAAWLKAHAPAVFLAAVLRNGGGFYHPAAYVLEARRMGVRVLLPHVNLSGEWCAAEYDTPGAPAAESRGGPSDRPPRRPARAIRVGLGHVRGISRAAVAALVDARLKGGAFTSFTDFLSRSGMGREGAESLIRCGAMDCFEFSRPELIWRLELLHGPVRGRAGRRNGPHAPELPMGGLEHLVFPSDILPRLPDFTFEEKLRAEEELLDMYVSGHPLDLHRGDLEKVDRARASDISRLVGKPVRLVGWLVASRRVFTKGRRYMKFLTMEDETDIYETVMFPDAYDRWGALVSERGAYVVEGRAVEEFGHATVDAARVVPLARYAQAAPGRA